MITSETRKFGDIPTLIVYKDSIEEATQNGTILLFHGFGSSKEEQRDQLESLAHRGFLTVGVDIVGHGERRYHDFESRFFADNPVGQQEFLQAVWETAKEVPWVIDELNQARLIKEQRVGIAGISMGGHVVYNAIIQDSRIKVAVSILGAPQWKLDLPESPHRHPDQFSAIKLMSQNAGQDEIQGNCIDYDKEFKTLSK